MKLLNYTSSFFAVILLILISAWAGVFYYTMLDEIYDSIDDGLDNQRGLVIGKASRDSTVLSKNDFDESDYAIREISAAQAATMRDKYIDTMMYMQNENSDEPVRLLRTAFLQNGRYYELQVATSMVEEDDLSTQLFYSVLWLYIGLIITILLFNNFLLKRIWHPFYKLLKQLKNFRLDKPSTVTVSKTAIDEFKLLNETVQKLLQRNIDVYSGQKNFIENASHELQTPLAISINKLEALAENGQLSETQMELLGSALDNLERLTRLNKALLLVSKIENKQFADKTSVNLNIITQKIVADFTDLSSYNDIKVTITEKGSCIQNMNPDLAAILITNLLKNAIIHNQRGGFVNIVIDSKFFTVENTGASALDGQNIFNRFYTSKGTQASTGLGLSIVKAIVDLYHFSITYQFLQKHQITIRFIPVSE